tara:strand:- start:389 stop:1108 length:720 start_codon:yes stop_codon:yes gene_type:complete
MEKLNLNLPKKIRGDLKTAKYLKDSDSPDELIESHDEDYSRRLRCGFSKREKILSFKDFKPKLQPTEKGRVDAERMLQKVKGWISSNEWLTLIGGVGVGKTHLLKSAIWETNGYYITAYEFDRRIKDFRKGMNDYNKEVYLDPDVWLDRLANAERHLAIDDIGSGYIQKGWTQSRFERLIDIRYRNGLPTAIATNFDGDSLETELGERIVSRITDVDYAFCVVVENCVDMRRRKRNKPK